MINYEFISEILGRYEGNGIDRGYIPCICGTWYGGNEPDKGAALGASGVTIATGFDLGQQTREGLLEMGISITTTAVLEPYIGLKREQAIQKLKEIPFTITKEMVIEIDSAVKKHYINETAYKFGKEAFEAAPKEVQAVATSLIYQFGAPRREASPSLMLAWDSMRDGDYKKAAEFLTYQSGWSTSHQIYLPRRKREAALLNSI